MEHEVVVSLPGSVLDHESFDEAILPQLNLLQLEHQRGNLVLDKVSVDLGNLGRASPYGILGITLVCEILYEMLGRKVDLVLPRFVRERGKDLLNFKWKYPSFGILIRRVANVKNGSAAISGKQNPILLPIVKIESWEDVRDLIAELQEKFCPFWVQVLNYSTQRTIQFLTVLSELCQNILYHSTEEGRIHGYLTVQVHHNGENSGIEFAVVDSGIGIPTSLRSSSHLLVRYQSRSNGDMQTIRLACNPNISSKERGGLGLYMVRQTLEKTGGILYIRSGNAKVIFGDGGQGRRKPLKDPTHFIGTQIGGLLWKGARSESQDLLV